MQTVAQSWLMYRLTHSAALLGLAGFAGQIPVFALAPLGGVVADRHNRHRVVLITQASAMLLAFVLVGLTLSGSVQVWQIFVLSGLLGLANAFDIPARQAFIVEMVGRDDLGNAIALNSSMFNGARIVGPAIAGLLVAWVGEGWCFFINALSYIAVLAGLLMMKLPSRERVQHSRSAWGHLLEGFRFVGDARAIRSLLVLLGLASLMGMPYTVLMPIFADRILKAGSGGLGILMSATGVGALFGALLLTTRSGIQGLGTWIWRSCMGFGAGLILFSMSRSFWLSVVLLVPVGFGLMVQMASSNTLIQSMVPDRLRGRVMAVYSMMFMGMAPFGSLLAGALARPLGAAWTVALGGACCMAGAAVFAVVLPGLREDARRLLAAKALE